MSSNDINLLQAFIDGMNAQRQRERSRTQMTLGQVIKRCQELKPGTCIHKLGTLDSYRGYYRDLAFDPITRRRPVKDVLKECRDAMGRTFKGYKGGDYMMGEATPVWVASYGIAGERLLAINDDGSIETAVEESE